MEAVAGIAGVTARIRSIEERFAPAPAAPVDSMSSAPVLDAGPAFDPFGEAYQRAVAAAGTAPPPVNVATSAGTGTRARWAVESLPPVGVPTGASSTRGSATSSIGGYGRMPVPGVLAQFGNGRVPANALAPIEQNGHRLYGPAAASWDAIVDAAAADGIDLRITDSYRSYEQQVDLAARKGLYSQGGLAATPGTSNHGWGLAVDADVRDPEVLAWLRRHGPDFGWVEAVPREPWHWEFRPHQV